MTVVSFCLVLISELCSMAGQIFFKRAMSPAEDGENKTFGRNFACGIAVMALGFFLWLGLLKRFDLSYLYPFDGMNRVLLVLAASVFLKEKASLRLWIGVLLISAGVMLVSAS